MSRVAPLVLLACVAAVAPPPAPAPTGALVAVGGGGTPDTVLAAALQLAGGAAAVVAVLPQASEAEDAGDGSVKMWRDAGAGEAATADFAKAAAARALLERATLIWISGGDQNRFMQAVRGTGFDDLIRARYRAGAVVGGTSAGAAVLSQVMITGEADLKSLAAGRTVTAAGLGLWPEVIVDQHFLQRQRHNRLLSAVLDRPSLLGVGIDEGTAVILRGGAFEVLGGSAVVVLDARAAAVEKAIDGRPAAARNVSLTILRAGMSFSVR